MIQHNCAIVNLRFRKGDGGRGPKMSGDLVQRGRKNKGLRGFVHQVPGGREPGGTPRAHHTAGLPPGPAKKDNKKWNDGETIPSFRRT